MKKQPVLRLTLAVGAFLASSAMLQAGIIGTPHDFSGESWNVSSHDPNTVCGSCHQPHNADSSVVPLWGHTTTTANFTMYNTANVPVSDLQSTPDAQPAGPSKACLSCHDGTVAVNSFGGTVQGGPGVTITNRARLGTDLTHSHPISLTYDTTIAGTGTGKDKWLFNPDTKQVLQPDAPAIFNTGNDMSVNGFLLGGKHRLECTSCHDVHNQEGSPFSIANNSKLVKIVGTQGGKGSLLCRSCHDK